MTDSEVRFGLSAPISGPQRDLGHQIRQGIEVAFDAQNDAGGVEGRKLALVVRDDGYEPTRAADTAHELREQDHVFATIGDVGTATATAALPYALDAHMPKLFAFTGADVLRAVPPDRIVFNLRASYGEETAAAVRYLMTVRGLKPSEIAVFAQDDAFGRSGVEGVRRTMRALSGGYIQPFAVVTYARNSMDVTNAVVQLRTSRKGRLKAVVMVATYKAAARFIEEMKPLFPGLIYTDVSFAGSTQLAEELTSLGRGLVDGVVVTQVVPNPSGHSKEVDAYRAAVARYFPGEAVDYVSLEGWLDARLLIEGLGRAGRNLTPENLSDALESIKGYDLGMGEPIVISSMDHQASHHVWGTVLDKDGH